MGGQLQRQQEESPSGDVVVGTKGLFGTYAEAVGESEDEEGPVETLVAVHRPNAEVTDQKEEVGSQSKIQDVGFDYIIENYKKVIAKIEELSSNNMMEKFRLFNALIAICCDEMTKKCVELADKQHGEEQQIAILTQELTAAIPLIAGIARDILENNIVSYVKAAKDKSYKMIATPAEIDAVLHESKKDRTSGEEEIADSFFTRCVINRVSGKTAMMTAVAKILGQDKHQFAETMQDYQDDYEDMIKQARNTLRPIVEALISKPLSEQPVSGKEPINTENSIQLHSLLSRRASGLGSPIAFHPVIPVKEKEASSISEHAETGQLQITVQQVSEDGQISDEEDEVARWRGLVSYKGGNG